MMSNKRKQLMLVIAVSLVGPLLAQTSTTTTTTDQSGSQNAPVAPPATTTTTTTTTTSTPVPTEAAPEETPIELSPFVVSSTEGSDSYQVTDTLAGTRVRTNLNDLGSAISVVDAKFMSDVQATDAQSLLQYTTNTEVGGMYGNFAGLGAGTTMSEDSRLLEPDNDTRVRGLAAADNTRNYFLTSIPWDNFNVDRVDMQRGPNSMLFGDGSPAGIINASLNDAMFNTQGRFETRIGQYGSLRNMLDLNYVLLPDELAARVVLLDDNEQYEQRFTYNHDKRLYAAIKYDPKWLQFPGAKTELRINDEYGSVSADNPRELPPVDEVTPFVTPIAQGGEGNFTYSPYSPVANGNGVTSQGSAAAAQLAGNWLSGNTSMARLYWANPIYYYPNATSPTASLITESYDVGTPNAIGTGTASPNANGIYPVTGGLAGNDSKQAFTIEPYSVYAVQEGLPGSQYGEWNDKDITNTAIFNFYKETLDGPNTNEGQRWNGFNADLSQTFLDNRIGIDLSMYIEHYEEEIEDYMSASQDNYAIAVDILQTLPGGAANPNVGRPYIGTDGSFGNNRNINDRRSWRAQLYGDLRSSDFISNPVLVDILGHHSLTAIASSDRLDQTQMGWVRWATTEAWSDLTTPGTFQLSGNGRNPNLISYIGGSLVGATSADEDMQGLSTIHEPQAGPTQIQYFNSNWKYSLNPTDPSYVNPGAPYTLNLNTQNYGTAATSTNLVSNQSNNPANYVGWTTGTFDMLSADDGDINDLYDSGGKTTSIDNAIALTWQGYLFDGVVVPAFGWRQDRVSIASQSAPAIDQTQNWYDPFDYTSGPVTFRQQQDSRTWSVVVHTPGFIKRYLPKGTDVSLFYDTSDNFQAQAIRENFYGDQIPDAAGTTKEYGFVVSALDGKASLKVDWYDTKVTNASLAGTPFGSNLYYLYLLPAWGAGSAIVDYAGLHNLTLFGNQQFNSGDAWYWDWSSYDNGTPYGAYPRTSAEAADDTKEEAAIAAMGANAPSQSFYNAYGLPINVAAMQSGNWANALTNSTVNIVSGPGGIQPAYQGTINGIAPTDTVDTDSKGVEIEIYAQPLKHWNITINAARDNASRENLDASLVTLVTQENTLWNSAAGNLRLWGASSNTLLQYWNQYIYGPYQVLLAQAGTQAPEIRPWHINAVTDYSWDHGLLKGFNVGGAWRWEQGEILGYALYPSTQLVDVNRPWHGPSDAGLDGWIGYSIKLTNKISFHTQINLHNIGLDDKLIPIDVEPDGSPAAYRIQDGQYWQWSNTFNF